MLTEKESGGLDILAQEHGDMGLSGANAFSATVKPDEGYAAVGRSYAGDVEIRSLLLRETAPTTVVVDGVGYTLDRWNLALIGPKQGHTHGSMTVFDAGETSFALSASYNGAMFRAGGTNATAFTLQETATGWQLDGLELELDDGNGKVWSLRSASPLVFGP